MELKDLKAYEIIEDRQIKDLSSRGIRLRHKKTGAKIVLLSNDDENKVFYIGFRTPPEDSTGVAHITEHSVLCGSRKYPVKDPFVELAKGSLNTFLNAMTYPDKTVYPVASCNDADFQNLIDVYLDAVFYPNTYENESIFRQEGWHYEFDDEGKLIINGVVYNEMKGVFSSPDDVLSREVMNSLYPDSIYGVESGGDPIYIPDLTYEQFLDFHRAYYHPSNSYIYLYGNMDMAEKLDYIDREYLSKFDKRKIDSEIKDQPAFKERKKVNVKCSLAEGENARDNTFFALNYTYGEATDRELYLALSIIDYALITGTGAPLKKALTEKGIGNEVYSVCENGIKQPFFSIIAKGVETSQEKEFIETVENVIEDIVKNGFDKKSLLAAIVKSEFKYREADFGHYPKGLMYGLKALDSWLYDENKPFVNIEILDLYDKMKKNVDTGYFEKLLKAIFIDNSHSSLVVLTPELGLSEKKDAELADKVAAYQSSLSDSELSAIKEKFEKLRAFQEQVDTRENLEKLPLLKRSDLKAEAEDFSNKEFEIDGVKALRHDYNTNGISYLSLMFCIDELPGDLYPYLSILTSALGQIDTDKHNYTDLNNELNLVSGGCSVIKTAFPSEEDIEKFRQFTCVNVKYLYQNAADVMGLVKEFLFESHLDDTVRLYEILAENRSQIQSSMISAGHSVALGRAFAGISTIDRIGEITSGIDFYRFISDIVDNYDSRKEVLVRKLKETALCVFRPENLFVDLICEGEEGISSLRGQIGSLKDALYTEEVRKERFRPELLKGSEGFMTAGQVQYVCRAGSFVTKGLKFTGALSVLKTIMGYNYLWENVRVKGGAYGCFSSFARSGLCAFVSYRDPNLEGTVKIYENAADAVANFEADERTMTKYVIGTFSGFDIPLTPSLKGARSLGAYMNGTTYEIIQRVRDEARNCTVEDIRKCADIIKAFMSDEKLVVVGSSAKIKENSELFDHVENLF